MKKYIITTVFLIFYPLSLLFSQTTTKGFMITYYGVLSDKPFQEIDVANDGYEYILLSNLKESLFIRGRQVSVDEPVRFFYAHKLKKNETLYTFPEKKISALKLDAFGETLWRNFPSEDRIIKWEIDKNMTREIAGYTCYLARGMYFLGKDDRTGRPRQIRITAWFTPELPYPFGPYVYKDLPGLVLAAGTPSYYYVASNVKLLDIAPNVPRPHTRILTSDEYLNKISEITKRKFGFDIMEKYRKLNDSIKRANKTKKTN